jgi:hypothetical protein
VRLHKRVVAVGLAALISQESGKFRPPIVSWHLVSSWTIWDRENLLSGVMITGELMTEERPRKMTAPIETGIKLP